MKIRLIVLGFMVAHRMAFGDLIIRQESISEGASPLAPIANYATITQKFKGEQSRVDFEIKGVVGNPANYSTIVNRKTGSIYRVWHSRKTYDIVTPEELQSQQEHAADSLKKRGALPAFRPILRPTGRKDKINGYLAEEYVAQIDDDTLTYWFAKSLVRFVPVLAGGGDPGGGVNMLRFPDPASFPGVPVRMNLDQSSGGYRTRTTINMLSIEERPLADGEFALPNGYQETRREIRKKRLQ
jgi:hypothetical protein